MKFHIKTGIFLLIATMPLLSFANGNEDQDPYASIVAKKNNKR